MADIVIGAGVIGLHIALYLQKSGRQVIVIDRDEADNNCSYGNAGYISPSHFIPLATPGIVLQGLKWMFDSRSPFYIKPRFDRDLLHWGYHFWKSANKKKVEENAPHLYNLLNLSRLLTIDLHKELDRNFLLREDGCLMLYTQESTGLHETELAKEAKNLFGLDVPVLSHDEVKKLDPLISKNVLGAAFYPTDCHLHPGEMMKTLKNYLKSSGVSFYLNEEVTGFEKDINGISKVICKSRDFEAFNVVIAAGSWSSVLSHKLGINIPLQAGKGYSYTYKNHPENIKYPAILVDHRVAMTPMNNDIRVGGTMEIGGLDLSVSFQRIPPIINAANHYYDKLDLPVPQINEVWAGLRPVSPDGLPFIGRSTQFKNVYLACGHAMIGISSAAATGLLMSQMINGRNTEIQMDAFRVNRF
jgi:D-amino-acid dehydrogenase